MIQVHRGLVHARPLLVFEADRLERLASDLRAIADGQAPQPHDIGASPLVERWHSVARTVPTIVGVGQGHPRLADGFVQTTEIIALDLVGRWARTLSRYYVLGKERSDDC
ncbi:DUF6634 family protein [Roseomonas populi]|uniref:Uncharacterized protein n=1 Tax=Roseomonas populi TaxID=3121582 RepID=A0ABT1X5T7_9PROT|nr:DUF6634 family protein [Roseomonas pecuniae]MCR0983146.1 hypothetical protein [Roseomonas pecuniae]